MPTIINIETSGQVCSVALTHDGVVEFRREDTEGMRHAECLAPFVEEAVAEADRRGWPLEAVAVSIGPGSYTGLRIGLSLAKGLCFAREIPLIGVPTLQILAVKAMFRNLDWTGEELLLPMLDARRMEVYAAVYNFALEDILPPQPVIVDGDSFADLLASRQVYFMGDGSVKCRDVIKSPNAHWLDIMHPNAADMTALAEKAFYRGEFLDLAYSVPEYLKEYRATVAKNKVLGNP